MWPSGAIRKTGTLHYHHLKCRQVLLPDFSMAISIVKEGNRCGIITDIIIKFGKAALIPNLRQHCKNREVLTFKTQRK